MRTKKQAGSAEWVDPDDAPKLTPEMLARAEIFEGDRFIRPARGRPSSGNARELISFRLDPDVVAKLRAAGPGWHSQVNQLLREALGLPGIVPGAQAGPYSAGATTILRRLPRARRSSAK